jgi:hypothetical protein
LEETKHHLHDHGLLKNLNGINVTSKSEEGAPGGQQNHWVNRYKALTEYDQLRHDSVRTFVDGLRRLEERGIVKHVGKR